MYKITQYSLDKAKKLGVSIKPSVFGNYKLDVYMDTEYVTSIGDRRYSDYPTYIATHGKEYADRRRKLYKARHESDRHIPGTRGFFADKILW